MVNYLNWLYTIGANEPGGTWKYRFTFGGKTYDRNFFLAEQDALLPFLEGNTYCSGETFSIGYGKGSANYNLDNVFTAQLSDVNGSFALAANITTLGSTANLYDGTINAQIPSSIQSGDKYRIRVISSLGATLSVDNGYDLHIKKEPSATLSGSTTITHGQSVELNASLGGGAPYYLVLSDSKGKTFDDNTGTFKVSPTVSTNYNLVSIRNACGIGNVSGTAQITVSDCPSLLVLDSPTENYNTGTILKQASATDGKIIASNQIQGASRVTYQAKIIELNPDFKSETGTVFKAEAGGCN